MSESKYWYMLINKDYKPLVTAASAEELADKVGVSPKTVRASIWFIEHGVQAFSRYVRIPKELPRPHTYNTDDFYYIQISKDEYELPTYVAESIQELARVTGAHPNSLMSMLRKYEKGELKSCRYRRVLKTRRAQ